MAIVALIVIVILLFVLAHYIKTYFELRATKAAFLMGYPLVYRLPVLLFSMDDIFDLMVELFKTGPLVRAFKRGLGSPIVFASADPEVNRHVLQNVDNYIKGELITASMDPLLGDGIFNTNGAHWLDQRKMASFMFAKREIKAMVNIFDKHFESLKKVLIGADKPIEMQATLSAFTLDCFLELALGLDSDSLTQPEHPFGRAFNEAQANIMWRFVFYPLWKVLPEFMFPFQSRLKKAISVLDEMLYGLIQQRHNDPHVADRQDLLSRYIVLQREQKARAIRDEEVPITEKYIRDVMLNFILAGRDTTSQTLLWAMYLLALPENSEVRERVEAECREVGHPLTFEKVQSLPYTERFIYETLRLYPPVPTDPKTAVNDDVLPGGYQIKSGQIIMWTQNVMGRIDRFFPDPLRVNPDRWLGAEHNGGIEPKLWSGAMIPFQNGGRRVCMGQEMALTEVKSVIASLCMARIRLELAPNQKVKRVPNITISAKQPGIFFVPRVI